LNALSIRSFSGGFVNELINGIIIKGPIIAILEAIGELAGPSMKNMDMLIPNPPSIPHHIPTRVALFQYSPYKYAAMKEPATAPQERDIKVIIMANSNLAITKEIRTKTMLKILIIPRIFFDDAFGSIYPLCISIATEDADTRTIESRVDIDDAKTKSNITETRNPGTCFVNRSGIKRSKSAWEHKTSIIMINHQLWLNLLFVHGQGLAYIILPG